MNSNQDRELEYFRLLFEESDRGCVMLVAQKLDDSLKELHRAHIKALPSPSESLQKKLREALGERSAFATRIRLGHEHGLIRKESYEDLDLLRKLRNTAAHTTIAFSFQSRVVQAQVNALQSPKRADKSFFVTSQERQAVAAPDNSAKTMKLYFLLAGMCLNIEILEQTTATIIATRSDLEPRKIFSS